ncbi:MAG: pyrroline-5-carboxylate reductase [Halobacteriota archaeon]|nr:pyrroline-5-carboxylate reductase [Halobacteriota archaeon]
MTKKIGFIGSGNIGESIISGIIKSGLHSPEDLIASDVNEARLKDLERDLGISITTDNKEVVKNSKTIILAIKPKHIDDVVSEITPLMGDAKLIISVAAGVRTERIEGEGLKTIRVMPNMACMVGESMSTICKGKYATEADVDTAKEIFETVGKVVTAGEDMMDVVTGFASAPAFVFIMIEALADGGVHEGLDRETSLKLASQTVLGAAKVALEMKKHPGALKDMVASPAGTTIRGIRVIEEGKLRSVMMDALIEATKRSKELGE